MNNPLGVSPSNGNQGTTRGKESVGRVTVDLFRRPGWVLPHKGLMGHVASQGMFFGIFVLNRASNLSFFVLIRLSVYQFLS